MSTTHRQQQPGSLNSMPGKTKHQRIGHKLATEAGYRFVRTDSNEHNLYRNDAGQRVSVVCSPKNSSEGLKGLQAQIRRHQREREAQVPTTTTPSTPAHTGVDIVDQLVALSEPLMLKQVADKRSPQGRARWQAYVSWLRRVLERYAPINAKPIEEATIRLGFKRHDLIAARKELNIKVLRETKGTVPSWQICLPHQVPEGRNTRRVPGSETLGVDVEKREPQPEPEQPHTRTGWAQSTPDMVDQAPVVMEPMVMEPMAEVPLAPLPPADNGVVAPSDAQAAMLMLAETLGLHVPGEEARKALDQAERALQQALSSVAAAKQAL